MFLFRKHLRNECVFETKAKLFLFLKGKNFNLQTKVSVSKMKIIFFETKMLLFRKYLRNESVCETKAKIILVFETFFCFFFTQMPKTKFSGWHACATMHVLDSFQWDSWPHLFHELHKQHERNFERCMVNVWKPYHFANNIKFVVQFRKLRIDVNGSSCANERR